MELAKKLRETKAKIKDIKVNRDEKVARISVEYNYNGEIFHKPFDIKLSMVEEDGLDIDLLKDKIREGAISVFEIDKPLKEIETMKGKWFNLEEGGE